MSILRQCDSNPKHKGPLYTVTLVAVAGAMQEGRRPNYRVVLGHLCLACIQGGVFPALRGRWLPGRPRRRT